MSDTDYYRQVCNATERELADWVKYCWGAFLGALLIGSGVDNVILDIDDSTGPGVNMATWLGLALLGAYYWRKRFLDKRLMQLRQDMTPEERKRYNESQ